MHTINQYETEIQVLVSDITKLQMDAIVNSANASLLPGSGLCGAIFKAAGKALADECKQYGRLAEGRAILTKGYDLPCKYVIHTVAPKWYLEAPNRYDLLVSCYKEIIKLCEINRIEEVAIPCIGMGIYRCPLDIGAKIAVDTVISSITQNSTLRKVFFVCGTQQQYELYAKLLKNIK